MSSVGFVDNQAELDKLREAYDSLKDVLRGNARVSLSLKKNASANRGSFRT